MDSEILKEVGSSSETPLGPREFTEEELSVIEQKRKVLSSLALFIGKDFRIPVELNQPGQGWHWDFKSNVIRADPIDLLEKPMDYLRFVISHEGGHRRISRVNEVIPEEVWAQPGFSFMMNAIEDPRDNNFVAENYPKFREWMKGAYEMDQLEQEKARAEANGKLGFQPRFMQAGFEYIAQWFKEVQGKEPEIAPELPEEVRQVVESTLAAARDSWWLYPSRQEADTSEENIVRYATGSYEVNFARIWPEFKKLVDQDLLDQETQEFLQDQKNQDDKEDGGASSFPNNLTEEENKALREFLEGEQGEVGEHQDIDSANSEPQEGKGKGKPIPLDQLPEDLKKKLQDAIDALPDEDKQRLKEKAKQVLKDFEDKIGEALEGKMQEGEGDDEGGEPDGENYGGAPSREGEIPKPIENIDEKLLAYRQFIAEQIEIDRNLYESVMRENSELIDWFEQELRKIIQEQISKWQTGFNIGKRVNIKTRIQEKTKGISVFKSKAWQRRELPDEQELAVALLLDVSGSMMDNQKMKEAFKVAVILIEAFNRLSINTDVLGFNDKLFEYQEFGQQMSSQIREGMGNVYEVAKNSVCRNCGHEHTETDLGWATAEAAKKLVGVRATQKYLITISDLIDAASPQHRGGNFQVDNALKEIEEEGNINQFAISLDDSGRSSSHLYDHKAALKSETKAALGELIQYFAETIYT